MDKSVERLVAFACGFRVGNLTHDDVLQAKCRIIDSIGCAFAAYHAAPSRIACGLAPRIDREERGARVWGSLVRTAADSAAFANAMMVRYLDFNDAYRNVDGCHPSDTLAGLLAVAEMSGASGGELLTALAVSYEIQLCFADSVALDKLGWDHAIPEAIACALGSGHILRLSPEQMQHALSLAVSPNLATHQRHVGELSMWKSGYAAMSARQGVFAALLAKHGMTGPHDPIEGRHGLWAQTRCEGIQLELLAPAGQPLAIARTFIKHWPVRDSCQLPIDTALELRRKVDARSIDTVKVSIYESAYQDHNAEPELWMPRTRETADHSMPFLIAVALLDGAVTLSTFERARYDDADVRDLMARIELQPDPQFTREAPGVRNCRIQATLRSGDMSDAWIKRRKEPKGAVIASVAEIEQKFAQLTDGLLQEDHRRSLLDALWDIEAISNVSGIVDLLAIPSP